MKKDLKPAQAEQESDDDEPIRELLTVGLLAAVFTVVGSLQGITSFASLTFIVIMGGMNYLAITNRTETELPRVVSAVGRAGTIITIPLLLWHLYSTEFGVFLTVVGTAIAVISVEVLYFERDWLVAEAEQLGDEMASLEAETGAETEN